MIFALRGLLVCFAFFAMVYCPLSLLAALTWWSTNRTRPQNPAFSANILFGLRLFPFAVSAVVTVFFTFPSFWLMERSLLDEDAGTFLLAGCALLILSAGIFRVIRAQSKTTRAVSRWSLRTPSGTIGGFPARWTALSAKNGAPPLLLVGVHKPRVMVSDVATASLTSNELELSIRHEQAHGRSWDNLKKILINATPFPGMTSLENAWREMAEFAADDAAVANRQDALDLAAALIKLARLANRWAEPVHACGFLSAPSSISHRVERLLEWRATGHGTQRVWPWTLLVLLTLIVCIASNYGATLVLTHRLTEILVP